MKNCFPILIVLLISALPSIAQDDVNLFDYWKFYSDVENSMYKTSCELAFEQLGRRKLEIAKLKTEADFHERQALVKEKLNRLIGPMPDKTPLNAKITGVIKRDDYRVEKLVFESIPGYYVTAALFLPVPRKGKIPAVIYACGHTTNGFRSPVYQRVAINLVKKGFAVLAFDPIGQGERGQYFLKGKDQPRFNSTTLEHSYPGSQCYISGYSPTNYFVWDGIRCVDYLLSRKEIDPNRIGMTGRSGGGTQTAYTAAMDDRILAAAPECYITSMEYVMKSIGPQDAEQNIYQMLSEGLDHADLLEVRAPKPGLMVTTTRDFFSIQGARETFGEVKRFYQGLGVADNIDMVEDDDGHASTKKNRQALYAFFQKHLDNPGSPEDLEVATFDEEELWVTETGNLATSLKGETLFTLNRKIVQQQVTELKKVREQRSDMKQLVESVKKISGFEYPEDFGTAVFSGRTQAEGYELEKYLVPGGAGYQLPVALFKPTVNKKDQTVVIFDEQGMEHAAGQEGLVEPLVQQGYSVIIADIPGIGSMGPGYLKGDAYIDHTSFNQWFAGNMTGKSTVAMRAEDMVRIVNFVKSTGAANISVLSMGAVGSELLHASVFDHSIDKVGMIGPFLSYAGIALSPEYKPGFIPSVVAGAINSYDLPDLMAALSPRELLVVNPENAIGELVGNEEVISSMSYPLQVFKTNGISRSLMTATRVDNSEIITRILSWLE